MTLLRAFKGLSLFMCLSITLSTLNTAQSQGVDPDLIQALKQATYDIQEGRTDLDSLTWLASMSDKLEKRIPNPYYRISKLRPPISISGYRHREQFQSTCLLACWSTRFNASYAILERGLW